MTSTQSDSTGRAAVVVAAATVCYRAHVVGNAGYPDSWRQPDWTAKSRCRGQLDAPQLCTSCPVLSECLASALITQDPAPIRAGLTTVQRQQLWQDLVRCRHRSRDALARSR